MNKNDHHPPEPERNQTQKVGWLSITVVVFLLVILAFIAIAEIGRQNRKATMQEGTGNMKSLFYLMIEYDGDYGEFPNGENGKVNSQFSNDYFAIFFDKGYTGSEEVFYFKGGSSVAKKPDNVISPRERILEPGECGFALIVGSSTDSKTSEPIILAPMMRSGTKFNPQPLDKKCVSLRVDGAVKMYRLNNDNEAVLSGGKTLFESGLGSVWGEEGFDLSRLKHAK